MDKAVYVCLGTCKAEISEAEYDKGLTKCGAKGCTLLGHSFEKRMKCPICRSLYGEGQKHVHG